MASDNLIFREGIAVGESKFREKTIISYTDQKKLGL
jgi:hypothetical protein